MTLPRQSLEVLRADAALVGDSSNCSKLSPWGNETIFPTGTVSTAKSAEERSACANLDASSASRYSCSSLLATASSFVVSTNIPLQFRDGEDLGELLGDPLGDPIGEFLGEPRGEIRGDDLGEPRGEPSGEFLGVPCCSFCCCCSSKDNLPRGGPLVECLGVLHLLCERCGRSTFCCSCSRKVNLPMGRGNPSAHRSGEGVLLAAVDTVSGVELLMLVFLSLGVRYPLSRVWTTSVLEALGRLSLFEPLLLLLVLLILAGGVDAEGRGLPVPPLPLAAIAAAAAACARLSLEENTPWI
mmetsp:Transcript_2763/g.4950  ORF Transcript_2763/g.4950 Transcript_2763/m.4950 type:complete len:298 (+) Transcript_2763:591-1484(+)